MSTYAERQAYRDAHPGVIVDANSAYDPKTGQQTSLASGGGGGGGGGGAAPPPTDTSSMAAVKAAIARNDQQITALLQAMSATNEQDFKQKVSEFNQSHALALQEFGLKQQAQQFSQAATTAGFLGTFNGQQTQAAQQQQFSQGIAAGNISGMYNGQPTEQAREYNTNIGLDLTKLGASLSGPADYFKFNNAMNNGQNILSSLTGDQARPAFSAPPAGSIQPLTLQSIMSRLGISSGASGGSTAAAGQPSGTPTTGPLPGGTSGGTNQQAIPGGPGGIGGQTGTRGSVQNGLTLPNGMGSIPLPHQINPSVWDSWGPTGQQFIKSAAAAAGYDPAEYEKQVNATRPGTMTSQPTANTSYNSGGQSAY